MYNEIHFTLNKTVLSNKIIINNYLDEKTILQHVTVFDIQNNPKNILVNGNDHVNYYFNSTEEVSILFF